MESVSRGSVTASCEWPTPNPFGIDEEGGGNKVYICNGDWGCTCNLARRNGGQSATNREEGIGLRERDLR